MRHKSDLLGPRRACIGQCSDLGLALDGGWCLVPGTGAAFGTVVSTHAHLTGGWVGHWHWQGGGIQHPAEVAPVVPSLTSPSPSPTLSPTKLVHLASRRVRAATVLRVTL
jgi:hypothetical protein